MQNASPFDRAMRPAPRIRHWRAIRQSQGQNKQLATTSGWLEKQGGRRRHDHNPPFPEICVLPTCAHAEHMEAYRCHGSRTAVWRLFAPAPLGRRSASSTDARALLACRRSGAAPAPLARRGSWAPRGSLGAAKSPLGCVARTPPHSKTRETAPTTEHATRASARARVAARPVGCDVRNRRATARAGVRAAWRLLAGTQRGPRPLRSSGRAASRRCRPLRSGIGSAPPDRDDGPGESEYGGDATTPIFTVVASP